MKNVKEKSAWVLILNWKNSKDTIECLESIVNAHDATIQGVVVCDNGSNDGSLDIIRNWFNSHSLSFSDVEFRDNEFSNRENRNNYVSDTFFFLIDNAHNYGFAGGNNIGLKFIMNHSTYDFVFLLNNDTLINSDTVSKLLQYCQTNPKIGMCGSKVIYYHTPDKVQAYAGASFNPILGRAKHIGGFESIDVEPNVVIVEKELDYILGAALMITGECLAKTGLMEDSYFLYYEEVDWATRAKKHGFHLGFANESIVFHKEGGSIGSSHKSSERSYLSDYYLVKSRLKYTNKFYPFLFPTVFLFSLAQSLRVLARGDWQRFKIIIRACLGFKFLK